MGQHDAIAVMAIAPHLAAGATRTVTIPAMNGPRRLLIAGLVVILAVLEIHALVDTVFIPGRFAVDLEIPLRAAERWLAGEPPYLASSFTSPPGATQPFLYPPYVLPFYALLTSLPRGVVGVVAVGTMLVGAIVACRRLGIPWIWLPLVLAWPPFAEAIYGANVQMLLFTAFVYLFYRAIAGPWKPRARDVADPAEPGALVGGLATVVGAIKVSQPHAWVYVLRHRPRAAIGAALVAALFVAVTVPLTGFDLWFDWVNQLRLAGDTSWDLGGFAMPRFLPIGLGYVVAGACLVAVWFVPRQRAGAWVGVLSVVGSLSLHIFGLLFLVPAMLVIRREAAVIAAICIATYSYEGAWAGYTMVLVALAARQFGREQSWPPWPQRRSVAFLSALPAGSPRRSVEVDPLLLDHARPMVDLGLDRPDVLTEDPDEEQLHAAEEVDADHQWRQAEIERVPPGQASEADTPRQ